LFRTNPLFEFRRASLRACLGRERAIHCLLSQQFRQGHLPLEGGKPPASGGGDLIQSMIGSLHFDKMNCTARPCGTCSLWFNNVMSLASLVSILLGALLLFTFVQTHIELPRATTDQDALTAISATVRLMATPASGSAPLVVTFTGATGKIHLLDFGDGTAPGGFMPTHECAPPDSPEMNWHPPAFSQTHTYTQPGTYSATLYDGCYEHASATIVVH